MFHRYSIALCLCVLATAAQAEERGTLSLTIDGDSYEYALWAAQSDWSGSESFGSVSIFAQPVDRDMEFGSIMFGFSLAAGNAERGEINLRTVRDGETVRYYAGDDADEGGLTVTLDGATVSGEELSVSGRFQTQAGTSDNYGRDIDLSDAMEIEGIFDVVLAPYE